MKGTIAVFGTNRDTGAVSRESYGNKAAVLAEMAEIGIPVPPGFALPVEVCEEYYAGDRRLPEWAHGQLALGIAELENATGLGFGSPRRPLMVSVRSGAAVSMPGIMQTILNVGLSRETVGGLVFRTGNPRFAWDCYRRLLAQYGEVVRGHDPSRYRVLLREAMEDEGVPDEAELDTASFRALAGQYERVHAEPRDTVSVRRGRPAHGMYQDRARVLGRAPRGGLPAPGHGRGGTRHGSHGAGHGLRQPRGGLGGGGRVHAEPLERRARPSPRLPVRSAGRRGRLGRAVRPRPGGVRARDARAVRGARPDRYAARAALQRHAGHRVHDRGGAALHPPEPGRKAVPARCAQDRGRSRRRWGDRPFRGARTARRDRPRRDQDPPRRRGRRAARGRDARLRRGRLGHDCVHR